MSILLEIILFVVLLASGVDQGVTSVVDPEVPEVSQVPGVEAAEEIPVLPEVVGSEEIPEVSEVEELDFVWPIDGGIEPDVMSSPFGSRLQASQDYRYDFHRGIDIPATEGAHVYAVHDAEVKSFYYESDPDNPYPNSGTVVVLEHEDGVYYSIYGHLSDIAVSEVGQEVEAGELIGYSGSSGTTTFKHLHFEIREGTIYSSYEPHVNPFLYLPYDDNDDYEMAAEISGDSWDPSLTVSVTAYAGELDINRVEVYLYDAVDGELLDEKAVDFNERENCGSDYVEENGVGLYPGRFNSTSEYYEISFVFDEFVGAESVYFEYKIFDVWKEVASGIIST